MTEFGWGLFQCPFYRYDRQGKTYCEGGVIRLDKQDARKEYTLMYCCNEHSWRRCSIAGCLLRQYERQEEYRRG